MNHKILIIDDNPTNLKLLNVILKLEQYEVQTAMDAATALLIIKKLHPKLILMDLQLPGMDGLELTQKIKKNPDWSDIKIIAITAYAMKGDEEKALAAGCDGYIAKPINTRELPKTIARFLEEVCYKE